MTAKNRDIQIVTVKRRRLCLSSILLLTALITDHALAQTVVATVTVGVAPKAVAANTVTNKIYVANYGSGNVTVIDGATNSTTTVPAGLKPLAVAVDEATNRIYVANRGDGGPFGSGDLGSVTVIDGATNSTTTVTDSNANGLAAYAIALNPVTNKIYVLNNNTDRSGTNPGSITVIDGATKSTTTVTDPNAISPNSVAVNPVTNKIYVANIGNFPGSNHGNITVIDGATNSTKTLTDPAAYAAGVDSHGFAVAVNSVTNKIYVANESGTVLQQNGGVTVIDGVTDSINHVTDPSAVAPVAVAVDPATNTIYVANGGCLFLSGCRDPGSITVIDGVNNSFTNIVDRNTNAPNAVAVNPLTSMIYVANVLSDNLTALESGSGTQAISVSISPISADVMESGSQVFKATVTGDPNNLGVSFSKTSGCTFGPACSGTLTQNSSTSATYTAPNGGAGLMVTITATSVADPTKSASATVTVTAGTQPPDFSLSPASTGLNVQPGGQATDTITIAPQKGSFASAIQLSCAVSGPSPLPTCTLSPASVTPGANSAPSTLTITAPAASAMLLPSINQHLNKYLYAGLLPVGMLGIILVSASKQGRRRHWVLCGLLLPLFLLLGACGSGSSPVKPPTNYTVTVTGTSGALQHTTQVTVTVQ